MNFIKTNKVSKLIGLTTEDDEIIEENAEIVRDVKISFLGTTSSLITR